MLIVARKINERSIECSATQGAYMALARAPQIWRKGGLLACEFAGYRSSLPNRIHPILQNSKNRPKSIIFE